MQVLVSLHRLGWCPLAPLATTHHQHTAVCFKRQSEHGRRDMARLDFTPSQTLEERCHILTQVSLYSYDSPDGVINLDHNYCGHMVVSSELM